MDDYGSIAFTSEFAEGILLVAEEYFEEAFADAEPGPDLDFLRKLVPVRLGALALKLRSRNRSPSARMLYANIE